MKTKAGAVAPNAWHCSHIALPFKQATTERLSDIQIEQMKMLLRLGYKRIPPHDDIMNQSHIFRGFGHLLDFEFVDDGICKNQGEYTGWRLAEDNTFEVSVPNPDDAAEMLNKVLDTLGSDSRIPKIKFVEGPQTKWHLGIHSPNVFTTRLFVEAMATRPLLGIAFAEAYEQAIKKRKRWKKRGCCATMIESHGVRIELSYGVSQPHAHAPRIDTKGPEINSYWVK